MRIQVQILTTLLLLAVLASPSFNAADTSLGTHGFAMSGDVKIQYVTMGEGPLVVMIHGFPDYWYTWREQMPVLADHFQVVAIDQRGYNKSGQPALNDTWQCADHFVQQDEAKTVTRTILS